MSWPTSMNEIQLFNFGLILALVPICQAIVQMLKNDALPEFVTRLMSLVVGIALTFLVRQAGVEGVSDLVMNPYLAGLTGLVVALIASGSYSMTKSDIVKQVVSSKTDTAVPSKLVEGSPEENKNKIIKKL